MSTLRSGNSQINCCDGSQTSKRKYKTMQTKQYYSISNIKTVILLILDSKITDTDLIFNKNSGAP